MFIYYTQTTSDVNIEKGVGTQKIIIYLTSNSLTQSWNEVGII